MSEKVSYRVFASWARRGVAALIQEADPASGPWIQPATFERHFSVNGVRTLDITAPPLPVLGPGSVTGLGPNAVVRTDPRDGATGVEDNYLVQIEFARADLPWMFTPAAPNGSNRLRPWLVLIVLDASTVQLEPGMPLPRISVNVSDLPDLDDSWGWAHTQVTVDTPPAEPPGNAAAEAAVEITAVAAAAAALVPASGPSAISRLLCPRRLQKNKTYLACVVPATRPGMQAGLGDPPDAGFPIQQTWTLGGPQDVLLPVYYSWRFSTGDDGDFKSLALRLHGVSPVSPQVTGFGTRTVDMSSPWQHPDDPPGPPATIGLGGALGIGVDLPLGDAAQAVFRPRLTKLLNFPAAQQPTEATGDPTLSAVAPPIYAGRHAGVTSVTDGPGWLGTLNLDPRRRIAAAFGTQYVQENQEFLMDQAWKQLGAVQEANRLQALAELAAEVGDRMHRRHIAGLDFSKLVAIAGPARTRILMSPAKTLHATVTDSPVPAGAATTAFNRFTRAQGPLGRRTTNIQRPPAVIERGLLGTLTIGAVGQDGIATLTPLTPPAITDSTAGLVSRSLQAVASIEKAIPIQTPVLFQAINAAPRAVLQNPRTLVLGPPKLRPVSIAVAAKPPDVVSRLTLTLATNLTPSLGIQKRFPGRVRIPDRLGADKTARVMACPQFTAPLAIDLRQTHPDWLLPGIGNFPDNSVTLLEADGAFVEAFLAGANHEMNREFLWRGYPTDQRGTPFRYFWPRPDRVPDIPPITNWPLNTPLGQNGTKSQKDLENMVFLLVRGELLHRFPRLIAHAAKGSVDGKTLDGNEQAWVAPDFSLRLDDRTTAFAYDLSEDTIRSGPKQPGGYFFVFAEPITGPRFNFDVGPDPAKEIPPEKLLSWTDLDWARVPHQPRGFALAGGDVATPQSPPFKNFSVPASWNRDAADIARIAFAQPFRVAFHADELLPPRKGPPKA